MGNMQAGPETFNQQPVPRDPAILLDLQKNCGSLKLRQFWQKRSLQQSRFRGRKQISFLDSQRGAPPEAP